MTFSFVFFLFILHISLPFLLIQCAECLATDVDVAVFVTNNTVKSSSPRSTTQTVQLRFALSAQQLLALHGLHAAVNTSTCSTLFQLSLNSSSFAHFSPFSRSPVLRCPTSPRSRRQTSHKTHSSLSSNDHLLCTLRSAHFSSTGSPLAIRLTSFLLAILGRSASTQPDQYCVYAVPYYYLLY